MLYIFKCFLFLSAFTTCILGQSIPIILLSIVDICSSCSVVMLLRWLISFVCELVFPWALSSTAEQCFGEGQRTRLQSMFSSLGLRREEGISPKSRNPRPHTITPDPTWLIPPLPMGLTLCSGTCPYIHSEQQPWEEAV